MSQQIRLFEFEPLNPDYWLDGANPDTAQEEYMCWKKLAGVVLAREFVVCTVPEDGYEFRIIPLTV